MICLKYSSNKRIPFVYGIYKKDINPKVITDTQVGNQTKYKEWIKDQFSIWDVSQIDLANLVKKFK